MRVSRELWDAVNAGIIWNGKTHGAFDITAAPLIHLWEKAGEMQRVPTARELELARSEMGVSKFVLHENGWTILKTAGVTIDLGGLGKGFTSDDIATLLQRQGVVSALVAMSGDIRAMGQRPDGRPWRVGIQDPRYPDDLSAIVTAIHLSDMAVSTSGNYRRFVEIDGKHCSHIVDPRSGWTVENVPSVSVIGPDALTTDILGTALSVLGVAEGLKLVESLEGVESLFMVVNDSGELILTRSSGFAEYEDVTGHKGREM
jgi:thiamine biosynthesis lipoprotein